MRAGPVRCTGRSVFRPKHAGCFAYWCLLVRHKHRHTNYHAAAASLPFKVVPAPLGVTHDTNATRPTTSTTAPPCPPPTRCAGGPTRAVAYEAGYFFRVVVVVVSSAVRLGSSGTTPNAQTSRISGTRFRALIKYDLKRSRSPLLRAPRPKRHLFINYLDWPTRSDRRR